jgi:predicted MFS family arabinose efflux permease
MLTTDQGTEGAGSKHPLARRMAVIAFLTNNITIGTLWGSFSVLLSTVETRLGIGRELSVLSIPVINLAMAVFAPLVGVIATRYSLRLLMLIGAVLSTAGFALLAASSSYPLYLLSYGLLLGPGMAIGVILPPTLVTRWFIKNRGRALGIVCTPVVVALVPLASSWTLQSFGLTVTYWSLAAVSAIAVIANLFVVDHPPGDEASSPRQAAAAQATSSGTLSVADLLRSPRFWALSLAAVSSITSSIILTAHMVPMAATWGYSVTLAATLLSIQSLSGIAGTVLFGWVADRIGSVNALALIVFDGAVLWTLLLLQPPVPLMAILVGLIGMHGAGVLPVLGLVLSETFGRVNFSRTYGISNLLNLPFSVMCVPAAAIVYTKTGSYAGAIVGQAVFFLIAVLLALSARRRSAVPVTA